MSLDQRYPLLGLDDLYVRRGPVRTTGAPDDTTWDEVIPQLSYAFGARAIEIFRRHSQGSPTRRSCFSIYAGSPLGRMRINVKRNYLKVYTTDQSPEGEAARRQGLGDVVPFTRWGSETTRNSGFTFRIETERQFEQFLRAVGELPG